jgi:hypothetical protein
MASAAFAPGRRQRWSILAGFAEAARDRRARRELRLWLLLALAALALAGAFALLLAASRVPGVERVVAWPARFFEKGLVVHVAFSFVVFLLAAFGALLQVAALRVSAGRPRLGWLGSAALAGAAASFPLLAAPALLDQAEPSLNNYVPAIVHPLYYAGLALLALGLALAVLRLFANLPARRGPLEPVSLAAAVGGAVYVLAMACFALALAALAGEPPSPSFNEDLFWGGGHALQALNTALLLAAWYVLGGVALGEPPLAPRLFNAAILLLLAPALAAPAFYVAFAPFSAAQTQAFTALQYALAPPALLVAGAGLATVFRRLRAGAGPSLRDPAFLALALSLATFGIGGLLGLFVDGADTRTPAHYHGVVAGITVAVMGLYFRFFLPLLERPAGAQRTTRALFWLFAGGQTAAALGLFWAGGHGAPRKVAGGAEALADWGALAGLALNGIGALAAVAGGCLFVAVAGAALLRRGGPAGERPGPGV